MLSTTTTTRSLQFMSAIVCTFSLIGILLSSQCLLLLCVLPIRGGPQNHLGRPRLAIWIDEGAIGGGWNEGGFALHKAGFVAKRHKIPKLVLFARFDVSYYEHPPRVVKASVPLYYFIIASGLCLLLIRVCSRRPVGKCLGCGYSLVGLATSRCPECGSLLCPQADGTGDPVDHGE